MLNLHHLTLGASQKSNNTLVTGVQRLNTLSRIKPQTYGRDDLGERKLGLVAEECEDALRNAGAPPDNVAGERYRQANLTRDIYTTLQYNR